MASLVIGKGGRMPVYHVNGWLNEANFWMNGDAAEAILPRESLRATFGIW